MYNEIPSPQAQLRLYLFGSWQLEQNRQPLRLPTRKVETLLAYLVLHPQSHNREKLAALLWGDSTDTQARASLRNALPILRKLHPDLLLSDRESVQINPTGPLWVDALEFQRQATAFLAASQPNPAAIQPQLYRGDLLADFYDDWLLPLRTHFQTLYFDTLVQVAHCFQTQGEYERAIATANQLLATDPTHEPAYQSLLRAYLALNNPAAGQRVYRQCRQILFDELGILPQPETEALYQRIQNLAHRPITALTSNLPITLTSFIGRQQELADLARLLNLSATRLLTLTGPGGSGKTRLAIEVAHQQVSHFSDGAWWVELAVVTDPAFVPQAVAKGLGLRETTEISLQEMLLTFLRPRRLLLVLDNCEHLTSACAHLATVLLQSCPHLRILATSREALRVLGETVWPVPPLDASPETDPAQLEAVKLFVSRATAVNPAFHLTAHNAPILAHICQRLDGVPLAIELAATRIKVLSPEQIATRLDDRFNLLTGGNRAALPRQQTLRATMDWSYNLLDPPEQQFFRALSVFLGGFSLPAAEAITHSSEDTTLELLSRLVDKSLVNVEETAGAYRYRQLETIRQYGQELLRLTNEETAVHQRHLNWFTTLAEQAEAALMGPEQSAWLARCEQDFANFMTALRWCVGQMVDNIVESGLRLGGALWQFWWYRGHVTEAHAVLQQLLARPQPAVPTFGRAKALLTLGILETRHNNYEAAVHHLEQSRKLWQALGDTRHEAIAWHYMAWSATAQGQFSIARQRHQESLTLLRDLGNEGLRDTAEALTYLGLLTYLEKDYPTARALQEEALTIKLSIGEPWTIGFSRWNLAQTALRQGDYSAALTLYRQALSTAYELGSQWGLSHILDGIGYVVQAQEQPQRAVILFGAAESVREAMATPLPPVLQAEQKQAITSARVALGEAKFTAAWDTGRAMTLAQAVEFALQ